MKTHHLCFIALLLLTIILAGCGTPPASPAPTETHVAATSTSPASETEPPAASDTPDPCVLPQLETEVQEVHKHMREFGDAATLASNIPREQLSDSIANLQRIRRNAEDEMVPSCLVKLKTVQIEHMELVIQTLLAFMGGTDLQTLEPVLARARQKDDEYALEVARLLGLTVVPATAPPLPLETPTPTP